MLDIKFIRSNPEDVKKAVELKNLSLNVDDLLALDAKVLEGRKSLEELQFQRNQNAKAIKSASPEERQNFIQNGKDIGEKINAVKPELTENEEKLKVFLMQVPNLPSPNAPVGKSDEDNVVIKTVGEKTKFSFEPLDHVDLLEKHNWADFKKVPVISGSRNYALKNEALFLEQAILNFAMDKLYSKQFDVMSVPSLVREESLVGTGHFPDGRDQVYYMPEDDMYLSGTAEVPINSLYKGDILNEADLPIKMGGYSPCFRREAGSAGRDVRGLIRVHQFLKVEQFVICKNDEAESMKWHQFMLELSEEILNELELPYQIVECCTGDMGLGKYRMFDIESWVPSEEKYRETHSCSSLLDWQARRTGLRYRDSEGTVQFCHTLNNTAIASPRILVPFLENHQQADGSIYIPEKLRRFMGGTEFIGKA